MRANAPTARRRLIADATVRAPSVLLSASDRASREAYAVGALTVGGQPAWVRRLRASVGIITAAATRCSPTRVIMNAACLEAKRRGAQVAALRTTDDLARPGGLYNKVGFVHVGHERIWELDHIDSLDLV